MFIDVNYKYFNIFFEYLCIYSLDVRIKKLLQFILFLYLLLIVIINYYV